jgi:hypothetical protein
MAHPALNAGVMVRNNRRRHSQVPPMHACMPAVI